MYLLGLYEFVKTKIRSLFTVIRSRNLRHLFLFCGKNVVFGKVRELHSPRLISIGNRTCFGDYLYMTCWPTVNQSDNTAKIVIGEGCNFGAMNHITCCNGITIGDNVLTGKWVTITDNSHGMTNENSLRIPPLARDLYSKGKVVILDNVWIGDGARIMPGVTIGKGAVVGANSVVTRDVPPYTVVCGAPAKVVKS